MHLFTLPDHSSYIFTWWAWALIHCFSNDCWMKWNSQLRCTSLWKYCKGFQLRGILKFVLKLEKQKSFPLSACMPKIWHFSQLIQPWSDLLGLFQQCFSHIVLYCLVTIGGTNRCTIWLHCHTTVTSLWQTAAFPAYCVRKNSWQSHQMSIFQLSVKFDWHVVHFISLVSLLMY